MIDPLSFMLGATLGNATLALGWLLTRWRQRWLRQRRDARDLMAEARRGTDVSRAQPRGTDLHHWSDICRNCRHERRLHRPACDQILQPHNPRFAGISTCSCTAFEASR